MAKLRSKQWVTIVLSLSLLLSLLGSCTATETSRAARCEPFMRQINTEHQAIEKPLSGLEAYTAEREIDTLEVRPYKVPFGMGPIRQVDLEQELTLQQAQADLEFMVTALRTMYGPYTYFGGDPVFEQAAQNMLEACKAAPKLTVNVLLKSMHHLSFIKDMHFSIMGESLNDVTVPYHYRYTAFEKTAKGYRVLGTKKMVQSIEGWQDLDKLMKRSLSSDGQVVYYPIILQNRSEPKPPELLVHYTDGSTQSLAAQDYVWPTTEKTETVAYYETQGIPTVFVKSMRFDEAGDVGGKDFLSYADKLKEQPVAIVDVRYNPGGNGVLSAKWWSAYTGQIVSSNYSSVALGSLETWQKKSGKGTYYISYESLETYLGIAELSPQFINLRANPDVFAKNDNIIIVLTSKGTASAAEDFVDVAHNVENTLIVGENTAGCLMSSAAYVIALPNSRIPIQMGNNLAVFPQDGEYFAEFVGFQPDLWVPAQEAEQAVLALLQRWGIGAKNDK